MAQNKNQTLTELWQITQTWLTQLGNKVNTRFCREEITTHPDYPAMTAVTDFLDLGSMQYQAVQADASFIHEFNYPLLAHIRQPGNEYLQIINNAAEWDKQKEITQHWSGIAIFPAKNTSWQNDQNNIYHANTLKNKALIAALLIVGIGLFIFSVTKQVDWIAIIFGLLSFTGLVISLFLLGTELGYQSQIVKQVCGAVSSGGCEKVLKSKYAKGFAGITPADASVIYFGVQFVFYLLSSYFVNFLPPVLLVATTGLLIAAWSIYTQAAKLKQWCALCLGIAAVLILQTTVAFVSFTTKLSITNFANQFILFVILCTLFYLILSSIKQLIKTNNINRQKLSELKKWKTDASLFVNQWQQEKDVDTTIWQNDLLLGNPNAELTITVACNPYCGPCAKAHRELDELLHRFPNNIKVLIRLLANPDNETDKRTIAAKAILQKATTMQNNEALQEMLANWFELMNLEKWIMQYPLQNIAEKLGYELDVRLKQHVEWISQSDIAGTPTFFINGHKLPGRYNIKDIEILIPQLAEILTNEPVK